MGLPWQVRGKDAIDHVPWFRALTASPANAIGKCCAIDPHDCSHLRDSTPKQWL